MKKISFIAAAILGWLFVTTNQAFASEEQTIWKSTYNGALNLNDDPYSMAIDSNGDVVVVGATSDFMEYNGDDSSNIISACAIKYSGADGHVIWKTVLHDDDMFDDSSWAGSVVIDKNNDVYMGGVRWPQTFIVKLSGTDGALKWSQKSQSWAGYSWAPSLTIDGDGNVISSAAAHMFLSDNHTTVTNLEVMKMDPSTGDLIWSSFFQPTHVQINEDWTSITAYAPVVDSFNDIYFAGNDYSCLNHKYSGHSLTMKVSGANGLEIWRVLGPESATTAGVAMDSTGSIVVSEYKSGAYSETTGITEQAKTIRKSRASDGSTIWETSINDPYFTPTFNIAIDYADNIFACGSFARGEWVAKYSGGNGAILWQKNNPAPEWPPYDPVTNYTKFRYDSYDLLAIDDFGDVHVTGFDNYEYIYSNRHSVKYDGASGDIIHESLDPGETTPEKNFALVDSGSNAVTIRPLLTAGNYDWCTTKFATVPSSEQNLDGPTIPDGWEIAGVADFNRDTHPDLLLVNSSTRATQFHYLNMNQETSVANGPVLPLNTKVGGVADFNGDKKPDVAVYNTINRKTTIGYLNNNVITGSAPGPTLDVGTVLWAAIDCDQDKKPDFVTVNPHTGATAIKHLDNNRLLSQVSGPTLKVGMQIAAVGTLNADKNPDYVLDDANYGLPATWHLNKKSRFISNAYGASLPAGWKVSAVADFDNDGRSDYLLYNPSTRATRVWPLK